jgi:hypothetical protein
VNRQFAPNSAIAIAVKDLLRNRLEQRIRRTQIDKRIATILGDEFGAALDEQRSIVVE